MAIKTATIMSEAVSVQSSRAFNDIIFRPGDSVESRTVRVFDTPAHVFGALPRGFKLDVYRIYDGPTNECTDIPAIPVEKLNGVINTSHNGDLSTELWLSDRGSYMFVYEALDVSIPISEIPEDVYVWFMYDDAEFVHTIGEQL